MNPFETYFLLGLEHITDANGYDHILFIVALCAVYQIYEWKKLLFLITSFTIGHSITLALATLQVLQIPSDFIEFLIPVTILITSFLNFSESPQSSFNAASREKNQFSLRRYFVAIGFGLIHGLGFSNYLQSLLGKQQDLFVPLLSFNLGLEIGQLLIVAVVSVITFLLVNVLMIKKRDLVLTLSGATAGISLILIGQNWIF
ncbi:MAG: HupE/UreJ family protein [Bacteroidetes bacterium]|nr:MAG: HupE/UreJ family protein [Bacteroidota bacterium]